MKKITITLLCLFSAAIGYAQQRSCATMEHLDSQKNLDPALQQKMDAIESFTSQKILQNRQSKVVGDIITLPVVVHVLYNSNDENISDAQILSQIEVLNEDFRRTNADADNTWSVAADSQIEFALATIDEDGNATTGITRKFSTITEWGTNDAMKLSSQGGTDAWDTSEYLNMWVCNIGSNLLGYAQFPGGSAATDGVVMGPQFFGSSDKGNNFFLSAPFDKGRTTTHEVGHFLNLRHIWGDGGCGVDDFVTDTPSSDASNGGCATGHTSCGSVDMVENYMDYSDDDCMNLFTEGQKDRMRAVLETGGIRRSLALSDKFGDGTPTEPTEPTECTTTINSFPYSDSFESSIGWNQSSSDDGDWLMDSNGTPSSNTGPSDAADGSFYIFLEASSNTSTGQIGSNATAILESDCLDFSNESSAAISFQNHMYGNNVGTLTLQASFDGETWTNLWTESGDQGNQWNEVSINLSAYLGETARLRFVGVTGDGWSSDIALDDISVSTSTNTGTPDDGGSDLTYCESNGNSVADEWIDFVSFGGISNTTGANGGYADFTAQTGTVALGSTNQIVFSTGFSSTSYTEFWNVWIDYNQDGVFADSESVVSGSSSSADNLTADVTIPNTATLGTTRMRVSMKYNAAQTACESFNYGEVEDYTVNITNTSARSFEDIIDAIPLGNEAALNVVTFPNPATNSVNVKLSTKDTSVASYRIVNIVGQTIKSGNIGGTTIDVSELESGLYIMEVNDGQKTLTTKLVKK